MIADVDATDGPMSVRRIDDQVSIVLLGSFNPKIFHPSWLALNNLISSEQADDAAVEIVHSDITQFAAAYMRFDIHSTRFRVLCDTIHRDLIRDLVLAAFGEHLPHTPISQLGINRAITYSCGTEAIRNKLGALLAPRRPWGPWGEAIERVSDDPSIHGGMTRLVMRQMPRPDGLDGHIQADLRPVPDDMTRVIIDTNNHFEVNPSDETVGSQPAMQILDDRWEDSMNNAESIVDGLIATTESLK